MAPQLKDRDKDKTATAADPTVELTADTQTEAMRSQPSTNSNTTFRTNRPVLTSVTRSNAKDPSLLANITSSCPMAVNK